MFEQFGNYSDVKWRASAAAQAIGPGDKIQISPDLENFKLERFRDLRKQPHINKGDYFKLMLIGSSKTNISIEGPDTLIDILVAKLPQFIGKSWEEIEKIKLERNTINCDNFLINGKCPPWIIDKFEFKVIEPGQEIPYINISDLAEADKICAKCDNFKEPRNGL